MRCRDIRLSHPRRFTQVERPQQHPGLRSVSHPELLEDRGDVSLHRALLNYQPIGDLLVEQAFGEQGQYARLLLGETGQPAGEIGVGGIGGQGGDGVASIPPSRCWSFPPTTNRASCAVCSTVSLALFLSVLPSVMLSACGSEATRKESVMREVDYGDVRMTAHRDHDDLLSAGLGLDGLAGAPSPFADPARPTPAELRRRAIQTSWKGIADLGPLGGYGTLYGGVPDVPGREYQAFARVPGANSPHRVLLQLPDHFDLQRRCLVVTASSGSRGVYGAIALAGAWGLPQGLCRGLYRQGYRRGLFRLRRR